MGKLIYSIHSSRDLAQNATPFEITTESYDNFTASIPEVSLQTAEPVDECIAGIIDFKQTMNYMLAISIVMIILFSLLAKRTRSRVHCNGHPALCYPVNLIQESKSRFVYAAAFCVTAWSMVLITEDEYSITWLDGVPEDYKSGGKIVSCIVTGFIYYPIFAGLSSLSLIGNLIGCLYTWCMVFIFILANIPCKNDPIGIEIVEILDFLPIVFFYCILCLVYPYRFVEEIVRRSKKRGHTDQLHFVKSTPEFIKVKTLLHRSREDFVSPSIFSIFKPQNIIPKKASPRIVHKRNNYRLNEDDEDEGSFGFNANEAKKIILERLLAEDPGFRFSTNILSAVCLSWLIMYIILWALIRVWLAVDDIVSEVNNLIQEYLPEVDSLTPPEVIFWFHVLKGSFIFSLTFSFCVCAFLVLGLLRSYKRDLLLMQKGIYKFIPRWSEQGPIAIMSRSFRFAGYQAGFAASGYIFMSAVMFLATLAISIFAGIVFRYKKYYILLEIVRYVWPVVVFFLLVQISKVIMIKYCFLMKDKHGNLTLSIDNRHLFFNIQYFMVFINAALGLLASLITIAKSIFFGIWTMPRLDMSAFPRAFERFDTGFKAYWGMLKLDHLQRNPVLLVFAALVLHGVRSRNETARRIGGHAGEISRQEKLRIERIKNRWALAVTLSNNPGLILYRKAGGHLRSSDSSGTSFGKPQNCVKKSFGFIKEVILMNGDIFS